MKHKITSKIYLKVHPQDNEMVELYRDTIRRWTDDDGNKRARTETSVFAVMHIDLFEGEVFDDLTNPEDPDDYTEVEFKLVHPRPMRRRHDPDEYGDYLYEQRKDALAEEKAGG